MPFTNTAAASYGLLAMHAMGSDKVDAPVMPFLRCQRGSPSAPCAGLQPRQLHANPSDARVSRTVDADEFAGEADQDRCQGGQPRPLRHVPDGRGRSATTDVQRNPHVHCPVAGATRTSVKGPRIRERRASMKAIQRAPAPGNPIAWVARGTPSRGKIVVMNAPQQTIALAGAGIVECRLNPRSPTVHTWLHVLSRSTSGETIWEMPAKK